ncbi:MAG: hypothetical protein AB7I27_13350 [Bacteriovoracaceae bacterium]
MMPKLFILILFLCSCAKPHYVTDLEGKIDGISGECGLFFESENLCLKTTWIQRPSESDYGEMELTFVDKMDPSRKIDPVHSPKIVLWMPSMGHGSSPVTLERIDVGHFKASEIFFIMPGPWDIRYQLKDGSNVVEEKIQKITI